MSAFVLDTSCMIAVVCSWHEHHAAAVEEIEHCDSQGWVLISAAPALVEAYAVLTRLPEPHRLSPAAARTLVQSNFIEGKRVVAPAPEDLCGMLSTAPERGIRGGRIYDAVISICAINAGASTIITFNERDFNALNLDGVMIKVPGKA